MNSTTTIGDLGTQSTIAAALWCIGAALKRTVVFPDRFIPLALVVFGALLYGMEQGFSAGSVMTGAIIGFTAVGAHQLARQTGTADRTAIAIIPDSGSPTVTGSPPNDPQGNVDVASPEPPPEPRKASGPPPALIILLVLLLFAAGCKTAPGPVPPGTDPAVRVMDVEKTAAIVSTSAQLATYFMVRDKPSLRPAFEAAAVAVALLVDRDSVTPEAIRAALRASGADQEVAVALEAAVQLVHALYGTDLAALNGRSAYVRPLGVALVTGVRQGLDALSTEVEFGIPRPGRPGAAYDSWPIRQGEPVFILYADNLGAKP